LKQSVYRPYLYNFLSFALDNPSEKKVLDCGAGGPTPPLSLFHFFGFETHGIDISENQIEASKKYCEENKIDLNIKYGDMRDIPFEDESFGFVYSIFSSVHLTKKDTGIAVKEMERVLKKGGLCYITFLSLEDMNYGEGIEYNLGECTEKDGDETYLHSYYSDDEADAYFKNSEVIYKEKHKVLLKKNGPRYRSCHLDYIVKKR
jgi:ubiquinone/menaquinone biosynthesis C-methylase UbiE